MAVTVIVAAGPSIAAADPLQSQPVIAAQARREYAPVRMNEADLVHFRSRVAGSAARSGLALLTDESPNEVRIWHSISAIAPGRRLETWNYVITPSQALGCKVTHSQGGNAVSFDRCEIIGQASHVRELVPLVTALLPYADTRMFCEIADGNHFTLDGVHDGKRFFIQATNPDFCRDVGSRAVAQLIQALQQLQSSSSPAR